MLYSSKWVSCLGGRLWMALGDSMNQLEIESSTFSNWTCFIAAFSNLWIINLYHKIGPYNTHALWIVAINSCHGMGLIMGWCKMYIVQMPVLKPDSVIAFDYNRFLDLWIIQALKDSVLLFQQQEQPIRIGQKLRNQKEYIKVWN